MLGNQRTQKLARAGEGNYAISIVEFTLLDDSILGLGVGVGQKFADGRNARPPMRAPDRVFGIEAML
jgi:hypothetical protein